MKTFVLRSGRKIPGSRDFVASQGWLVPFLSSACLFAVLVGSNLLVGCGGGSASTTPQPSANSSGGGSSGSNSSAALLVSLGEYASVQGQIVALELSVDSVTLRSSSGDVALLSTPRRIEVGRLKAEPLLLGHAPQGKYSGIAIAVSNPEISYFDAGGVLHENVAGSLTSSNATNSSAFSLDSTPTAVDLNLLLPVDFSGNAVSVTPAFNFSTRGGRTSNLVGRVTTVGSNSFALDIGNGTFTFATDPNTTFQGLNGLSGLSAGMTVEVDAAFGSDGIFRATQVGLENNLPSAELAEGLAYTTSLAQMQVVVREVHVPAGVALPEVGKALSVAANASTQFAFSNGADLNNLDFTPSFDALTIARGQNLRISTTNGSAATFTADQLKLEEQSLDGIAGAVGAGSVSGQFTFPINLDANSAFAQLTGQTSVLVTVQPSTEKFLYLGSENCVPCIAGGTVRVRGLLFFSGGQYRLVAEWLAVTS